MFAAVSEAVTNVTSMEVEMIGLNILDTSDEICVNVNNVEDFIRDSAGVIQIIENAVEDLLNRERKIIRDLKGIL